MARHDLEAELDAMFDRAREEQTVAPQSALDQALAYGADRADDVVSFLQSTAEGATAGLYAPFPRYVGGAAAYPVQNIMGTHISFVDAVDRLGGERAAEGLLQAVAEPHRDRPGGQDRQQPRGKDEQRRTERSAKTLRLCSAHPPHTHVAPRTAPCTPYPAHP